MFYSKALADDFDIQSRDNFELQFNLQDIVYERRFLFEDVIVEGIFFIETVI